MSKEQGLRGLRILNTRPEPGNTLFAEDIAKAQGMAIACPLLEITATSLNWLEKLTFLNDYQQAIFTSPNAVDYFFQGLAKAKHVFPKTILCHAIGEGTANALKVYLTAQQLETLPEKPDSEHLLQKKSLRHIQHQKILLIKGLGGRTLIKETLTARGAKLTALCVYQRMPRPLNIPLLKTLWQNQVIDIILFTSLEGIEHFHQQLFDIQEQLVKTPCIVLSERLAQVLKDKGYITILIASPHNLINTLKHYAKGIVHD